MERVTFPDDAVRALFSGLVSVKLDVDLEETAPARERFKEEGGVPVFVLTDADGVVLWRSGGTRPAGTLVEEVRAALEAGPPPEAGDIEAVQFRECVRLVAEGRHAAALAATDSYLKAHEKQAEAVKLLRARARYGQDGVREAWLEERVRGLIGVFDDPWPGNTIGGLAKRALGGHVDQADADRWVQEQNDAGDTLMRIGEPAVDLLIEAMRDRSARVAERCGWVIGRIRSPRARTTLLTMASDPTLRTKTRIALATAMGGYKERVFLDALAAWVRDRKQPRQLRYEATNELRGTLDGRTDVDALQWADFLLDNLEDPDVAVRGELLQALLDIRAPYDLGRLAPLLKDERVAYLDVRVCDLACWCVLRMTGKRVDGADDTTPEVVRFVETWLLRTRANLVWDADSHLYVERDRSR